MGNYWKPYRSFDREKFANLLRQMMGDCTQRGFAQKCGVSLSYIAKLLNERLDSAPTPKMIQKIASALTDEAAYYDLLSAAGYRAECFCGSADDALEKEDTSNQELTDVQLYLRRKLQEQAAAIARRIFMISSALRIQDVMYVTGLSREMTEKIFEECEQEFSPKQNFIKGYECEQVEWVWRIFQSGKESDIQSAVRWLNMSPTQAERWRKEPAKCAVLELRAHGYDISDMPEKLLKAAVNGQTLEFSKQNQNTYKPVFTDAENESKEC